MSRASRLWAGWDVACVLAFVVVGRRTHDHGVSLHGVARTAWPFLAGLAVGWLALARRRAGLVASGAAVAASTVAVGMVLRVVAGQGTAVAFVLVATAFLGLTMVGGRAAALAVARRRG